MDSLCPYHPFLPLPWKPDAPGESKTAQFPDPPSLSPSRLLRGPEDTHILQEGDFCIVRLRYNGFEPLVVMQFLTILDNNQLELRWISNRIIEWYIDRRMHTQEWRSGWWQQNLQQSYYSNKPLHFSHVPYTNTLSGDVMTLQDVAIS